MERLRGFGTETVTLIVGPEGERLHIPRDILLQIPYFTKTSDDWLKSNEISLPDSDPAALADAIYFFWTKDVPAIETDLIAITEREAANVATQYIKVYSVAHKLALGTMKKEIRKVLVVYHQTHLVHPRDLVILCELGHRESLLTHFLIAQSAYDFVSTGHDDMQLTLEDYDKWSAELPANVLLEILTQLPLAETMTEVQPADVHNWFDSNLEE